MHIAFDAREFISGRQSGIARFLIGIVAALSLDNSVKKIILCVTDGKFVPESIRGDQKISISELPASFLGAELALSNMSRRSIDCLISPYRKLPLFGNYCPAIHTIHDVLDLTHCAYRRRLKMQFEKFRLKAALGRADLTWFLHGACKRQQTRCH